LEFFVELNSRPHKEEFKMAYVQTPKGVPRDKWQLDPVSALHEHYKKTGQGEVTYTWKDNPFNLPSWVCVLTLPDMGKVVHGSGPNKKEAKMAAARNACSKYFN
jgi:dsRNA-specific ribonuclease